MDDAIKGLMLATLVGACFAVWAPVIATYLERRRSRPNVDLVPVASDTDELRAQVAERDHHIANLTRERDQLAADNDAMRTHMARCSAHQPKGQAQ